MEKGKKTAKADITGKMNGGDYARGKSINPDWLRGPTKNHISGGRGKGRGKGGGKWGRGRNGRIGQEVRRTKKSGGG